MTKVMKNLSVLSGGVVLALALLASSCANPVATLRGNDTPASSNGESVSLAVSSPKTPGSTNAWFTQSSIYQIFPATFSPQGNLAGITAQMNYISDLGVKTIWLMPIFKSMNTHGYDASDYYAIAGNYGNIQDLTDLVNAAHAKDIRVVLDLVVNHTGTAVKWFSDSNAANRHDNWYIWSSNDKGWDDPWNFNTNTNVYGATWIKDPYADYDRDGNGNAHDDDYYYSVFGENGGGTMPDLNWKGAQTDVTNEVVNIMKFWIDNSGVDGYRCDAARYLVENGPGQQADQALTHTIWQNLRARLTAYAPGAVLIAESPTEKYSDMKAYYGSNAAPEFNSAFHFKYSSTLMSTLKNNWYDGSFWADLFAIQSGLPSGAVDTIFLSNHDSFTGNRVATQLNGDSAKIKLAGSLYITLSGNPATYYGEEYGMQNTSGQSGDNAIRGNMDWNTVNNQKADKSSALNHYRALYMLRNTYDALRGGISFAADSNGQSGWSGYTAGGNHIALIREYYGEKILVVHNLSSSAMNVQVNLTSTGLSFVNNTPVTVIMGSGTLANINTANQAYYDVGSVGPYSTKIVYLGAPLAKYNGMTYDIGRNTAWTGDTPTTWTAAYFRGTANSWGTTLMTKTAGLWTTTATFDASSPRFKITHFQDWNEAYPATDFIIPSAGTYLITFDEVSKNITATPTIQGPAAPSLSYASGTVWTLPLTGSPSVVFSDTTAPVTYRYTLDNTNPTVTAGTAAASWAVPAAVGVYTLKVVAIKNNIASPVTTGSFTVQNGGTIGTLTIKMKANGSAQNVKFPGDFNAWNINTGNAVNVAANTTATLTLTGVVTSSNIALGSNASAMEFQVINVAGGSWSNGWGFSTWTKVGCSVPDGKQITIPCASGKNVTLTIDVSTTTLTAVVQ